MSALMTPLNSLSPKQPEDPKLQVDPQEGVLVAAGQGQAVAFRAVQGHQDIHRSEQRPLLLAEERSEGGEEHASARVARVPASARSCEVSVSVRRRTFASPSAAAAAAALRSSSSSALKSRLPSALGRRHLITSRTSRFELLPRRTGPHGKHLETQVLRPSPETLQTHEESEAPRPSLPKAFLKASTAANGFFRWKEL